MLSSVGVLVLEGVVELCRVDVLDHASNALCVGQEKGCVIADVGPDWVLAPVSRATDEKCYKSVSILTCPNDVGNGK